MPPRFDEPSLLLELSVADLLDSQVSRSIGFGSRGGFERLWLGQAIHSRYQEQQLAADSTYRREVVITHRFEHRGWTVVVQGRADGLRRDADGSVTVEEIKSVRRGGTLSPAVREMYQRQAQLYAWMLLRGGETKVRAQLVLIEIGSDETEHEDLTIHLEAIEASVHRRVNILLRAFEAERQRQTERARAAERLVFPYSEMRPGQELIVAAVENAMAHREHLLIQATTGIGKTVAALYPALRDCLANGRRLFVLTAKTLQQEMATSVLGLLNQDAAFHALRLRAKAKMCANDQLLCHEEYCRFAKDYTLKLQTSSVLSEIRGRHTQIEPEAVFAAASAAEVCPFEVSLELANRVEVTVCDYNYAFDPYVALTRFGADQDLSDVVLVIDEIHNLVERGRGYYSPALSATLARRAAEGLVHDGTPLHVRIATLCLELARIIEEAVDEALEEGPDGDRAVETPLPDELFWGLRPAFDEAFIDHLEHQRESRTFQAADPFVDLYFTFLRFLNGLANADHEAFSQYVERSRGEARVRILCRDPSRFLGAVINRTHSTIGLSATLTPPEFYTGLLGFESGRTAVIEVPNPFPPENRRVVIDASVATTYRVRAANYDRIAERLAEFAEAVPGNCLALFPSYGFLAEVCGRLRLTTKRALVQRPADTDKERDLLLTALRTALLGDVLLLAVAGGAFAEGVDYPGDTLKAVAIIGPCLPALTLEQQLLKQYYEDRFERGFEFAFVVPGMTRVVQAAGRLIRSPTDTGVIALFDERFLASPYRLHLPSDWLPESGAGELAGNPAEAAEEFFRLRSSRPVTALAKASASTEPAS
jgi:DNA excision repair protein ERCC-2